MQFRWYHPQQVLLSSFDYVAQFIPYQVASLMEMTFAGLLYVSMYHSDILIYFKR